MASSPQKHPPVPEHKEARYPLPEYSEKAVLAKGPGSQLVSQVTTDTADPDWKDLVDTLRAERNRLLRIPGVTAVDIGYKVKEKDHAFEDKLVLRVHVERKLDEAAFRDRQIDFIAPEYTSPSGNAVKTDVIQAKYRLVQLTEPPGPRTVLERPTRSANRRRRIDPLVGGISIGSPQVPVGTLGALVWDQTDGSICLLSNWHVLAGDLSSEIGTPCFQPGLFDQGRSTDVVARLKRWSFDRYTDAAIAQLTGSRRYCTGEILGMFQTIKQSTDPYLGMTVRKSGRSTGFTSGFVDGLFFSSAIEYNNGVVRVFEDQIHIAPLDERISEPGDSGAVWVTTDQGGEGYLAVGLHFAGDLPHSAFGEYALANPMSIVEERLQFSFRPLFLEVREEAVVQESAPPAPQAVHIHLGAAGQPMSLVLGGLMGSGTQPDQVPVGGGGKTKKRKTSAP